MVGKCWVTLNWSVDTRLGLGDSAYFDATIYGWLCYIIFATGNQDGGQLGDTRRGVARFATQGKHRIKFVK